MDFKLVLNCPNFVAFLMLVGNSFQIFGPMVKIVFILCICISKLFLFLVL